MNLPITALHTRPVLGLLTVTSFMTNLITIAKVSLGDKIKEGEINYQLRHLMTSQSFAMCSSDPHL